MSETKNATSVFISYSHDSHKHQMCVLDLADHLRKEGLDCVVDQYIDSPAEGWPRWTMNQVEQADFVIMVFTETYARRFSGKESPGTGRGAAWEGAVITQEIYDEGGRNRRFLPVVMATTDLSHIPTIVRGPTHYDLSGDRDYDALYGRLTNQFQSPMPPVGTIRPLPKLERKHVFGEPGRGPPPSASADSLEIPDQFQAGFAVLNALPNYLPSEVLLHSTGMAHEELADLASRYPNVIAFKNDLVICTSNADRSSPLPASDGHFSELLAKTLRHLLVYVDKHKRLPQTRVQVDNVLALARQCQVTHPREVATIFDSLEKILKRIGDKRLVLSTAKLALEAARRQPRTQREAEAEAKLLICGLSWSYQRMGRLTLARAYADESLALGEELSYARNTAFCKKCIGRLLRIQSDSLAERNLAQLEESEATLRDALDRFAKLLGPEDTEVGDCHSLLGRTLLARGDVIGAGAAARTAYTLLKNVDDKDYLDLCILRADIASTNRDFDAANSFYDEVLARQLPGENAEECEIFARAHFQRARSRISQGNQATARLDFDEAARIWGMLDDHIWMKRARWAVIRLSGGLHSGDIEKLSREPFDIRVAAYDIHVENLAAHAGTGLSRRSEPDAVYWDQVIREARVTVAIEGHGR